MLFLSVAVIFVLLLYFALQAAYFLGLLRLKTAPRDTKSQEQALTVIIPFRDEASGIGGILSDLENQDYPLALFSVILVNDHSSDGSEKIAESLCENRENFFYLDLPHGPGGKKEALALAIAKAETAWILQTDADCRVGPGFLRAQMSYINAGSPDLVAGLVTTQNKRGGFLEAFERLDQLGLAGAGAGSFGIGKPIMCSGANLMYRKELYQDTRSFDPADKVKSGDDMFLLIGARKLKKKLAFNSHPDCLVRTAPAESLRGLILQRIRWGAKSAHYRMPGIQAVAMIVALSNFFMLLAPVWIFLQPAMGLWLLSSLGAKVLVDFLILLATSIKTSQTKTLWWYLPVALLYPVYISVVFVGALLNRPGWKGRRS